MPPNQRLSDQPSLPLDLLEQIDSICLRFESAWQSKQRPSLATFLSEMSGPGRSYLLRELLKLELDYCKSNNESVNLENYYQVLPPEDAETIRELIQERDTRKSVATAEPVTISFPGHAETLTQGEPPGQSWPIVPDHAILGMLGKGTFGTVYLAREQTEFIRRLVALKVSRFDTTSTEECRRFEREMQALVELKHPNIVYVYRAGEAAGKLFYSMELVTGGCLADYLRDKQPLTWKRAAHIVATMAQAIEAAHQKNIIHRDLKPDNVLISLPEETQKQPTNDAKRSWQILEGEFTLKITDFGLAKKTAALPDAIPEKNATSEEAISRPAETVSSFATQPGTLLGTAHYMPPEHASGKGSEVHPAADIYSLGIILYQLLTGHTPFEGKHFHEIIRKQISETPVAPRLKNKNIPRDLEAVCLKCLEKDPAKRYATAARLAKDLAAVQKGLETEARPWGSGERVYRFLGRNWAACIAMVLLLASGIGYWLASYYLDPELPRNLAKQTLERGEPLIVTKFPGPFRQIFGEPSILRDNGEGAATLESLGILLFELVDDPMCDKYLFSAEVRHEEGPGHSRLGLYFAYHDQLSATGTPLYRFVAASYADRGDLAKVNKTKSEVQILSMILEVDPARFQPLPSVFPFKKKSFEPSGPVAKPSPWRKIHLTVSPTDIQVEWFPSPDANEPLVLKTPKAELEKIIKLQSLMPKHFAVISNEIKPRSSLGLFFQSAKASFRNVRLEPLP